MEGNTGKGFTANGVSLTSWIAFRARNSLPLVAMSTTVLTGAVPPNSGTCGGRMLTVMGPLLVGLDKSVQIAPLNAKMREILNTAVLAAYDINR